MEEFYKEYLKSIGIDIYDSDYKKSEEYIKIKDELIFGSDGSMTMEHFMKVIYWNHTKYHIFTIAFMKWGTLVD